MEGRGALSRGPHLVLTPVITSPYRWAQPGSDRLGGVCKVAKPGDGALGTQSRVS